MSSEFYPTLPGLGFSVKKTPKFQSRVQTAISGKESRISDWTTPRFTYELTYEILREHGTFQELRQLAAFWLCRRGSYDTFLFVDPDDNTVTGQAIATADGVTTNYQLIRSFGAAGHVAWIDPVLAPTAVTAVYLNGVSMPSAGNWGVFVWGADTPGVLVFTSAPSAGVVITVDMSYAWPCRFVEDTIEFEKFMDKMWEAKTVTFITVK